MEDALPRLRAAQQCNVATVLAPSPIQACMFLSGAAGAADVQANATQRGNVAVAAHNVNEAVLLLAMGRGSEQHGAARLLLEDAVRRAANFSPAAQALLFFYLKTGRTAETVQLLKTIKRAPLGL